MDIGIFSNLVQQSVFNFSAGKVQSMGNAPGRMSTLTSQIETRSILRLGHEMNPDINQLLHAGRSVFNYHTDNFFFA